MFIITHMKNRFGKCFLILIFLSFCSIPNTSSGIIEIICGEKLSYSEVSQEVNENFIFQDDPNFQNKNLYDAEGNRATVRSWVECKHYVDGGWNYYETGNVIYSRGFELINLSIIFWTLALPIFLFIFRKVIE